MQSGKKTATVYAGSLFGAALYVLAINVIITPLGLYSGTLTGIAQLLRSLLAEVFGVAPASIDLTGVILMAINLPLFLLAWRAISRTFFVRSLVTTVFLTALMSVLPIPADPLIDDTLTCCVIGGILAGLGAGLILRFGSSGGGLDIVGVALTLRHPNFSVGKLSILIGAFVYLLCLIRYDLGTVIYSAIFTTIYATALDRAHHQNIKCSALIFTHHPEVADYILQTLHRGATRWEGMGAYTGERTHVFITVISKYEAGLLKRAVRAVDPGAFIIFHNDLDVSGNFESRL